MRSPRRCTLLLNRWSPQRVVRLTEEEQGDFALQAFGDAKDLILPDQQIRIADGAMAATLSDDWKTWLRGSRAEVILRPGRFMFRPLELPKRAGEFLEGIVRSQIDRLTPWSVNEAAYTWTPPIEAANDRIQLTVAATARSMLMPYVRAVADLGAASVIVSTVPQDAGVADGALKVYEQRNGGTIEVTRIRQILMMVFIGAAALALVSSGVSSILGDSLDSEQQDLSHKIAARRAAMRRSADGGAQRMLERRKQTTPAAVMVLDALSKVLPDHTYVTRAAHRERQGADDRHHPGRAFADPADRAVAAFRARDVLRADHAVARRARRTLPHRGTRQAVFPGGCMNNLWKLIQSYIARVPHGARGRLCRAGAPVRLS